MCVIIDLILFLIIVASLITQWMNVGFKNRFFVSSQKKFIRKMICFKNYFGSSSIKFQLLLLFQVFVSLSLAYSKDFL